MNIISPITTYIFFVAVFLNLLLVFAVRKSDPKSTTNRLFVLLGLSVSVWLVAMYLSLGPRSQDPMYIKITLFFAVPMNALLFLFVHTFPSANLRMSKRSLFLFALGVALMMAVCISPLVFKSATVMDGELQAVPGIGLILFGLVSVALNFGAVFYLLIKKIIVSKGTEKRQTTYISLGIFLMFGLVIFTIFVPFVFFGNATFVAFFPLYTLTFLAFAAYAVLREGLFSVKVLLTEAAVAILLIILLSQIFTSGDLSRAILDAIVFAGVAVFGILLVKSVEREVRQREELERLNQKIETANIELEKLSKFKSELLSLASHQIRSPLAAIKGFISLILDGSYGVIGPRVKETLGKVQVSADELIGLINTLLDVRKVEEGRMDYQFATVDAGSLVRDVADTLRPLAAEKKLTFTVDAPKNEAPVRADAEKLKQAIQNLIDNAIKYTSSGYVRVALKQNTDFTEITVSDSGIGISGTLIPYLFEEFTRDERVKKQIRGTGLGLYIARKIIEAHGGTVWVESAGEGKGSVFHIRIPVGQPANKIGG